ncbi:hypothetical protein AGDE_14274 [Angomonas deanei]|nr:hypothetical protein AGDE_14274 [Angomonas deanei]|eukprot:EPY21121.1 hypothetical protein AGDE_14274 [Angomonas deanei]
MTEIYLFSQVTETSARNLILAHEQEVLLHIYLNFFDKQSQIDDEEKKRQHCAETLRLHRGTLFLPVLKNVLKGKRTDHFLKSVLDTVYLQKAARNKRGVFDFDSYFQTREVPSHLLDLQERDRCFYELNDLQIRQEAETRTLPEFYGDVVIYQNEEAVPPHTAKRKNWQAHRTFPYDSEEGDTVDISFLNRSADFTKDGAFCWVDEEESPLLYTSPASKRTTVLAKELRQWSVGTWLYASRWPFREERHSFRWSDAEDSSSVVRCRKLTRRRMDLRAKELREAMERKHQREVEQLRLDLNL